MDAAPISPDLATIIVAWPWLPDALKAGIVAMIDAAVAIGRPAPLAAKPAKAERGRKK